MDPNDERKKMEQQRLQQSAAHHGTCACHYDCTMAEISADSPLKARGLKVSRLARGVPVGGELEYVDAGTIARAMLDRRAT